MQRSEVFGISSSLSCYVVTAKPFHCSSYNEPNPYGWSDAVESLANEHEIGTCLNNYIQVGKWTIRSMLDESGMTNNLECSAVFIWKYEKSLLETNRSNHTSAFQIYRHHFPTRALCLVRLNEILNSSPSAIPSLKKTTRKCFWMCDAVILSFCSVQVILCPAALIVYTLVIWLFMDGTLWCDN